MNDNIVYIRREWTDEEVSLLKEGYGQIKIGEISKLLNRTTSSIANKARDFALRSHLKGLKSGYKALYPQAGFQKGNKPKQAGMKGYRNNGSFKKGHKPVPRIKNPYYTEQEIDFIKTNWGILSQHEMMKALPNRPWRGIRIKAQRLGLTSLKPTLPEKRFLAICQELNLPFKYIGNSNKFTVGRLKPDFIHSQGEKIAIDIFGIFWHSPLYARKITACRFSETRKAMFEKHGWRLVIFWDVEIMSQKAEEVVLERLKNEVTSNFHFD